MSLAPGSSFGSYTIVNHLGAGGMGEVYKATDAKFGRAVAIKVLRGNFSADPDWLRRFEQEARTAGLLNHPNLLTVHDVGTFDGQPYLVSEFLEGETLRARLQRGPLTADRVCGLFAQVARGLAAAHAKGVVHRDIKPENIFLTRDGRAKVLDFGIAKLLERDSATLDQNSTVAQTVEGTLIGTVAYMSPEQVAGRVLDPRSDLFSCGTVLYEMLAGRRPFDGATSVDIMHAVVHADPPALPSGDRSIPPTLAKIVARCLEKVPDERFQSAHDLAFALDSVHLTTDSQTLPLTKPSAARRIPASGAAVVAVIAALAALAGWFLRGSALQSDVPTFARAVKIVATDAMENSPVLSPDGKWMAYFSDEGGRTDVWVRYLSGGAPINLTASTRDFYISSILEIGGIDISPDGAQIAVAGGAGPTVVARDMSVFLLPAPLGGVPRKLLTGAAGPRWSPDGSRLVVVLPGGSRGDALAVGDVASGELRTIMPVAGGMHAHWPSWSADGTTIYFNSTTSNNAEPTEIASVPAAGGPVHTVVSTHRRALFPHAARGGGLLFAANPDTVDLALWWRPSNGTAVRLTTGVAEYQEARLSNDGTRMVATVYDFKRTLATLPLTGTVDRPTPMTGGFNGDLDPSISPSGDRVAFSSTRTGDRAIWTSKLDGSDLRQVTANGFDERPQWSPDARTIAFVSSRDGARGIWTVASDGGQTKRVVAANVLGPLTWSPDGREIAYAAPDGSAPALFRVALDGAAATKIATPFPAHSPSWSRVTRQLAYVASPPVTAPGTGTWAALLSDAGAPIEGPQVPVLANGMVAWSPDGKWLAGISIPGSSQAAIWILSVDGREPPRQLFQFMKGERPRGIDWMPDGTRVIFGLEQRTGDIVLFDQGSRKP